jgi:3-hydroxybutyryl-CoA dehydrogenase
LDGSIFYWWVQKPRDEIIGSLEFDPNHFEKDEEHKEMTTVTKLNVVGAGIMGSGIAQVAAQAGFQVVMKDLDSKQLEKGFNAIRKSLSIMKQKGKLESREDKRILARIKGTLHTEEIVEDADLIIEAIPEDRELKTALFQELDSKASKRTVLATNTSSISISALASATKRPNKFVGIHFSNPVPVMPGVELIRGRDTDDETVETAKQVIQKMGKEYYLSLDFPGFIGNRLLPLFINEAFNVLWQGIATAEDIDRNCKLSFRHPMGPLELADFIGLDTLLAISEYMHKEISEKYRPSPLLKQLVAAGHLGRKTGRGVYKY